MAVDARVRPDASSIAGFVALGIVVALATALVLDSTSGLWFFNDEWNYILFRLPITPSSYLDDVNGQLVAGGVGLLQLLYRVFGLTSYEPYRIFLVCVQAVFGVVSFVYLRRRIGNLGALVAVTLLLFLGAAWEDLLWPVQFLFYVPLVMTLAALMLVERKTRAGDAGCAACLVVGLTTSFFGIPAACAVAVELAVQRAYRRLWIALVPLGLYAVWMIAFSTGGGASSDNVSRVPEYTLRIAGIAVGALTGLDGWRGPFPYHVDAGRVAALVLLGLVTGTIVYLARRRHELPPRLAAVIVMPLAFWTANAITRAQFDAWSASRYVLPSAFYVILVVAELLTWLRPSRRVALVLTAAAVVLAVHVVPWNLDRLDAGRAWLAGRADSLRARLGALEVLRPDIRDPSLPLDVGSPYITTPRAYYGAVDRLGSSTQELRRAVVRQPEDANAVAVAALEARLAPATAGHTGRPHVAGSRSVTIEPAGDCIKVVPKSRRGSVALRGDAVDVDLEPDPGAEANISVDLFGGGRAPVELGSIRAPSTLTLPAVEERIAWTVVIALRGGLRICGST